MVRTTITLPKDLVDSLLDVIKAKNKTQAVIIAIEDEIRMKKLEIIKASAGRMSFVKSAEKIRHGDNRLG